ncbi:hypothetical protein NQZ79_g4834 [Umbelopsis isabellina]|nr:hypothetical protein NQZ79_g4834 [Umbelopsis isabellina]
MAVLGFSIWSVVGSILTYLVTQILSGYVWRNKKSDGTPKERWPPKPSKLPWLRKGLNLLGDEPYKKFTEWSKELGAFYSVELGSKQVIVANDADLVKELFVDQQQFNSGKITGDLVEATVTDTGKTVFTSTFSEYWRAIRIAINDTVNKANVGQFNGLFDDQSRKLVALLDSKLSDAPTDGLNPRNMVDYVALSIALAITTGKKYEADDLDLVRIVDDLEKIESLQTAKYTRLATFFPWLKAALGVKNVLIGDKETKNARIKMMTPFYEMMSEVEESIKDKDSKPSTSSICAKLFNIDTVPGEPVKDQKGPPAPIAFKKEHTLINITHITHHAYVYLSSALHTIIQRLATEEKIQEQAYKEITQFMKDKQLSDLKTKDMLGQLPLLHSIVKESLRLNPPQTLFTHAARADETFVYKGEKYRIDERNEILVNLDAIHQDPVRYTTKEGHGPAKFYPRRYMTPEEPAGYATTSSFDLYNITNGDNKQGVKRDHLAFGSGRRICLGVQVTERTLLSTIAQLIYHFQMTGGDVVTKKEHLTSVYTWTGRTELVGGNIQFIKRQTA